MATKRAVPKKPEPAKTSDPISSIATCFALDPVEHAILRLLAEAELSIEAWRTLHELGGPNARSLGARVGEVADVLVRLAPDGALRRHALVRVEAQNRLASADDALRIEVGLAPRQVHVPPGIVRHAPGVKVPSDLAKRLHGTVPQVVLLDAPPTQLSAQSVADGLQRPVYAGSVRGLARDAIARLRRDADLEDAVLWLLADDAALEPLFVAPKADALLVLAEMAHVDARAPWRVRREKMGVEASVAPAAPRNELDYVRLLAQRDADAALGIVRSAPPAPRPSVPGRIVDASVRVAEQPDPVATAPAPVAKSVAPPATVSAPSPTVAPDPVPAPALVASVEPVPSSESAVAVVEPAAATEPDGPRIDVPADASVDALARAAIQSPSALQRIELLEAIAGMKSAAVVAAVRHNAKSEHPGVRTVAERLMGQLFGANWNRSRAIVPPVQPPASPDTKP